MENIANPHDLAANRAFLYGDAVKVFFYVRSGRLIMAEECYFFLMASMRKMRMNIPLHYMLEFFTGLFSENIAETGLRDGIISFMVYRGNDSQTLAKAGVHFFFKTLETDVLLPKGAVVLDILKELSVNTGLLASIQIHCAEDIYAAVYARENGLDDVVLLNGNKRIARAATGNLLFLEGRAIRIPRQSEGAKISPLMENFVTFVHKNKLAEIEEAEMNPFESQKAEEILLISDENGLFPVQKIRNKTFENSRFTEMIAAWRASFDA